MLKTFLLSAALLTAGAGMASATDWRAQDSGQNSQWGYGNDSGGGGLGRYCPPGQYPHTWPNGGYRCQYANGDFSGAGSW